MFTMRDSRHDHNLSLTWAVGEAISCTSCGHGSILTLALVLERVVTSEERAPLGEGGGGRDSGTNKGALTTFSLTASDRKSVV